MLTPLLRLGGGGGLEPLLTHTVAQVGATPSDRVVWRPKPTCASRGEGYVSKVWPPAHIQPSGGGEQTALWYAELRNQRGRVLPGTRTPDLEAVVVGPSGVPSGHTQEWRNARTGQLYRPSPEPIQRTATYFWVAEIRIEETGEILSRISVPPPCPRKTGS